MAESVEKLLAERRQRIQDAYDLKVPDRVPIMLNFSYMLARLGGITKQELDADPEKAQEILEQSALYYQPDAAFGLIRNIQPSVMLGNRQAKFPGHGLGPNEPYQFVEDEYMKQADYDEFIEDPSGFTIRKFLPRIYEAFAGFADLLPLPFMLGGHSYLAVNLAQLADPAVRSGLLAMLKVSDWLADMQPKRIAHARRMEALGFPADVGAMRVLCVAPFDLIGDFLRGMRGVFLDMYRIPDKLLQAEEIIRRITVESVIRAARKNGAQSVLIPLHRGSDGFMSVEQFETFYWPQLKAMMIEFIEAGLKPVPFYEGVWDNRLEYLRQLPKGKTAGMFQSSDMFKVKDVVGDVLTIRGGFPVTLLEGGTPEDIREHTKKMCRVLGKNGGFIMEASVALDECDPELVKVWVDATRKYGSDV